MVSLGAGPGPAGDGRGGAVIHLVGGAYLSYCLTCLLTHALICLQ